MAETSAGKGALAGSGWLASAGIGVNGTRAANELARDADVVLCVGTRLSDFTTGSHSLFQHPDVRFVGINVNAADAHKLSATPVVADAREALDALRAGAVGRRPPRTRPSAADARRRWQRATWRPTSRRATASRWAQGEVLRDGQRAPRARATGSSPPPAGSRATC